VENSDSDSEDFEIRPRSEGAPSNAQAVGGYGPVVEDPVSSAARPNAGAVAGYEAADEYVEDSPSAASGYGPVVEHAEPARTAAVSHAARAPVASGYGPVVEEAEPVRARAVSPSARAAAAAGGYSAVVENESRDVRIGQPRGERARPRFADSSDDEINPYAIAGDDVDDADEAATPPIELELNSQFSLIISCAENIESIITSIGLGQSRETAERLKMLGTTLKLIKGYFARKADDRNVSKTFNRLGMCFCFCCFFAVLCADSAKRKRCSLNWRKHAIW
jgi:hypothetical protein